MVERDLIAFLGLADPVSSLTHLAGALGYLISGPVLLHYVKGDRQRAIAILLFLGGHTSMFLASGIYHSLPATYEHKLLWRHLDHSMIWWAIAGSVSATYTLAFPREKLGRRVVWLLAVGGVLLETLFLEDLPLWLSPTLYVCMGLTGIVPLVRIMRWFGFRFASPLLYGGIASITGAVIEAVRAPNLWPRVFEAHELLHCFIVLGMALFWVGIRRFTTIESEALAEAALSSA